MKDQPLFHKMTVMRQPAYEPTEAQLARAAARRRFNWLYIYTPLLLLTAVILFLTGLMIWGIFGPAAEVNVAFLSGLADIILILVLLPLILIWGVIVALPIGFYMQRYWRREEPTEDQIYLYRYGRFRLLLWQIDHKLDQLHQLLDERILPPIIQPIIRAHSLAAACKSWLQMWYQTLARLIQQ